MRSNHCSRLAFCSRDCSCRCSNHCSRVRGNVRGECALLARGVLCRAFCRAVFSPCSVAMRDEPTMADDDRRRSPFRTLRKSRLHQAATSHASRHIAAISAEQAWRQTKRRNFSGSVWQAIDEERSGQGDEPFLAGHEKKKRRRRRRP